MSQWVLKAYGRVVPGRSHRPLTVAEAHSPVEIKKRQIFDRLIKAKWGDSINPPKALEEQIMDFEKYEDDDEAPRVIPDIEDTIDTEGYLID
jgi:hypothetical protein